MDVCLVCGPRVKAVDVRSLESGEHVGVKLCAKHRDAVAKGMKLPEEEEE